MTLMLKLAERLVDARSVGATWYLSSPHALVYASTTLAELFRRAVTLAPERDFLVERSGDSIKRVTWAEAMARAESIAGWLVEERHTAVAALSGNSVEHALVMLGCFLAGVPFVPISPAYSSVSQDFAKLEVVLEKVRPTAIFAETPQWRGLDFAHALTGADTTMGQSQSRNLPIVTPDHVAKILFTSGSTGAPKGVPNTHDMLCANQAMITQCWPFLSEEPPVLVDWLPWSHTFGGNHNFNMVLAHAGTLWVDEGRPPTIDLSLRNVRELPPTLYFNVPAGYGALVPKLEADDALARAFFSRLRVMFYAAAALPPDLWTRLVVLAKRHAPREVFMTTAWGSTETSPLATSAHFPLEGAGNIGLPAPGVTLKLVPNGHKLEVRVKGPNVMKGYWEEPSLTDQAFDEEGYYKMGDAVKWADPEDPSAGLVFDGRVAEDFKLSSGTWVSVTNVRTGVLAAAGGVLMDVVVCGQDRDALALLAWPSASAGPRGPERACEAIAKWNAQNPSSSTRVTRVLFMSEPPNIDAGEITDKGYINQRTTQERRAHLVLELYSGAVNVLGANDPSVVLRS